MAYITRGLCNFSVTLEIYKFSLVFLFHSVELLFGFFLFCLSFLGLYLSFRERSRIKPAGRRFITKKGKSAAEGLRGEKLEWSWEVCNVNKWIGRNQR